MRFFKSKKAVSTVIATVLLINIAVVAGVLLYAWAQGMFGAWASSSEIYFQGQREALEEILALENMRFDPDAAYKLNITVRNVGKRDVYIVAIYLNNTDVTGEVSLAWNSVGEIVSPETQGLHKGAYHILIRDSVTFAFKDLPSLTIEEGDLLTVVVTTDRGTRIAQEWEASG
ncbi:MAG: archaellin/type IV pilin N-terminal domain-containing protein [Candidatus Bathyarchaeia archaeon]